MRAPFTIKILRIRVLIGFLIFFGFQSGAQVLGRLPVQLILIDDGKSSYTFEEPSPDGKLDLGRHMIKLTSLAEGHFIFELHEPFNVKFKPKTSSSPVTKIVRELKMKFYQLDFLALNQIFESHPNSVISFDAFSTTAESYIDWYLGRTRDTLPPPYPRPKLYKVYGLHLKIKLGDFLRGDFIHPHDADATYREVLDTRGNLAPDLEVKPLSFWEMLSLNDPLVHQILIIAAGEREIDLPSPFTQNNDQRGRLLDFRKSCFGPFNGNRNGNTEGKK